MGTFTRSLAGLYPRVIRSLADFTRGEAAGRTATAQLGASAMCPAQLNEALAEAPTETRGCDLTCGFAVGKISKAAGNPSVQTSKASGKSPHLGAWSNLRGTSGTATEVKAAKAGLFAWLLRARWRVRFATRRLVRLFGSPAQWQTPRMWICVFPRDRAT